MGFLDHSTNNIIVDAVLTDAGRRALARNDGSFKISLFALGDDEVDYSLIKQYGRTVGKEKIEKNTPVMEALTAGNLALKYKLKSLNNEFTSYYPSLTLSITGGSFPLIYTRGGTGLQITKSLSAQLASDGTIDNMMIDSSLRVYINNIFLKIDGVGSPIMTYSDNTSVYDIPVNNGSASISLTIKDFTQSTFDIYSTAGGSYIKTFVRVEGFNSGLTNIFEVRINKNSN